MGQFGVWMARGVALAMLLMGNAANAQVCRETDATPTGTGSQYFANCDMRYKDLSVTCKTKAVYPSCPAKPMPMKDTELLSPIRDLSPYLYAYARDADDPTLPYGGVYYRGTTGNASQTFGLFGKAPKGAKRAQACVPQIVFPQSKAGSVEEEAKMVRLELDNCTNQYILNASVYPLQKENATLLSLEDPNDLSKRIGLATHCQPLKTVKDPRNEYYPSTYLKAAWIKLLKDPTHRLNKKAPLEPHLPDGIRIENPINPPSPFPDVRLSMIAEVQSEEINDPSHPFSPRWDFEFNERDHYSPKTKDYGGDEKNAVFCAGDKNQNIIKVDILSFREAALKFDDKINDRIEFNKNCKANSGPQAYPCCKVDRHGSLNPLDWTCKLQPCATCYKFTADAPVCSTNYITKPDRKKVSRKYLPVPPPLRIGGFLNAMNNVSLSSLNALTGDQLNVGQALSLVKSPANILAAVAPNSPLSAALPLLNGQATALQALAASGLAPSTVTNALSGQLNVVSLIAAETPIGDVRGLLNGQSSIVGAISRSLPINDALSGVRSMQSLVSSLPGTQTLRDAQRMINAQLNSATRLANQIADIPQATQRLTLQYTQMAQLPGDMTVEKAISLGSLDRTGLEDVLDLPVRDARSVVNSTMQGLRGATNLRDMNQYVAQLNSQVNAIQSLAGSLKVGDVASVLSSTSGTLESVAGQLGGANAVLGGELLNIQNALNSQLAGLANLPQDVVGGQIASILGSEKDLLLSLGGSLDIGGLSQAVNGQLAGINSLARSLPVNQVLGTFTGQVAQLKGVVNGTSAQLISGVRSQFQSVISPITSQLNQVTGSVARQLTSITNGLTNQLNSIVGPITSQLNNVLGGVTSALPLKSLSGVLDAKLSGLVPGLNNIPGLANLGISPDQFQNLPYLIVKASFWPRTAKCNPNEFGAANNPSMEKLCGDLRAPFAPINKLKMRYHNPEDTATITLAKGVPEGFTFRDYFKDGDNAQLPAHMPYPRLWDTGRSIQRTPSDKQDPLDTAGQFTAIVGIGREGDAGTSADAAEPQTDAADQRCLIGGWGDAPSMGGVSLTLPDPISSWTELKLYQTRTIRDYNLVCLARYEKLYKTGSTENVLLAALGAEYSVGYLTRCNAEGKDCITRSVAQDKEASADAASRAITQLRNLGSPLQWRGYASSAYDAWRFPALASSAARKKGLNQAELGDIVLLERGGAGSGDKPGLPKLGVVIETNLAGCDAAKNCFIKVAEADNGKWPDICGTTDNWGELKTRYLYKPGMLPANVAEEYERIKNPGDCVDPHLNTCVLNGWGDVEIYRPREDRITKVADE